MQSQSHEKSLKNNSGALECCVGVRKACRVRASAVQTSCVALRVGDTLPPHRRGLFVYLPYVPCMKPGLGRVVKG